MAEPDDGPTAGMARWVKVFLVSVVGVALLVAVVLLVRGGDHGPDRHMRSGDTDGSAPVAGAEVVSFGTGR